jgi:hypothetical protein
MKLHRSPRRDLGGSPSSIPGHSLNDTAFHEGEKRAKNLAKILDNAASLEYRAAVLIAQPAGLILSSQMSLQSIGSVDI